MEKHIIRALDLLETRGPASAYDYIQRAGLDRFPPMMVAYIRSLVWVTRLHRQRAA
jgi:hypothetical protein